MDQIFLRVIPKLSLRPGNTGTYTSVRRKQWKEYYVVAFFFTAMYTGSHDLCFANLPLTLHEHFSKVDRFAMCLASNEGEARFHFSPSQEVRYKMRSTSANITLLVDV
ncbi:Uncharacterized protein Fot_10418 [Forsythia ovata]|uniref:Uncharacterized protein n=1 Tax=Forsythia ovata TaxID=205694 RepID=A0ABD1WJC6_9LAMI